MNISITDAFQSLTTYQQNLVIKSITDFLNLNDKVKDTTPSVCPRCGNTHSTFIKKGFARGKQRYLCKSCNSKFVYTLGSVSFHSQQSFSKWAIVIADTLHLVPIVKTAATINVHPETVFNMRHKILMAIEQYLEKEAITLEGLIEVDETYLNDSYKGKVACIPTGRKPRRHGESAKKRGISNEKICICTGSDRNGGRIIKSVNRAKPSKENILSIYGNRIEEESIIINDGVSSYLEVMKATNSKEEIVPEHKYYTKVFHLNTVNNLHGQIKEMNKRLRGVATKYLNRYLSLLNFMQKCIGMDVEETLYHYLDKIHHLVVTFTNKDVKNHNLLTI